MVTNIQKWGNSQGIRIPKYILEAMKWKDNEQLTINAENDALVIKKTKNYNHKTIKELFTDYNGTYESIEIDWGEPKGKEVW